MSPDSSWIENIWAWADNQLKTRYPNLKSIPELEAAIIDIFKHVPKDMLQNYVKGMRARLEKVVLAQGAQID